MSSGNESKIRVGMIGYGHLGKYLVDAILNDDSLKNAFELVFVWNRTFEKLSTLPGEVHKLKDLDKVVNLFDGKVDLIVEVSHPSIISQYGAALLGIASLFVGSPTALADPTTEDALLKELHNDKHQNGIYIPSGALWGAQDIQKMASLGTLEQLIITMKKHPASFKLEEPLHSKNQQYLKDGANDDEEFTLYDGPVRDLCPLAPNNVNTMACAALAAGFDKVKARLVAHKKLEAHIIDIQVIGKGGFKCTTNRYNPAAAGAVTGNATYGSFLSSLKQSGRRGKGLHFC